MTIAYAPPVVFGIAFHQARTSGAASQAAREASEQVIRRLDLERHLRAHGCAPVREGGRHTVWENVRTERRSTIPRHRDLPRGTARAICDQLGVPRVA
jgi:mRNA interferase HicA